ncbi:MAG: creatinine amidohydrolase [Planctomycetes bacterium]|jgi:creatinine amidohydrolase|nr:creatinine amidohydrolase [Planctomycetota bacterium]MDP6424064.1 creatininase family protein [Planctomycetota bacterium]
MSVHKLAEITWEEARDVAAAGCVCILPIGATEAHGPHLPLATDVIISEAMAEDGARRLADQGHEVLLLPSLAYAPARFAESFAGTLSIGQETATALIVDLCRGLASHGVATLAVANSHFDPGNIASIYAAKRVCDEEEVLRFVFPDATRKPWVSRLTDEFKTGACHAGRYEGSIVLARRPDLVRDEVRKALEPNPASLSDAIRTGKQSFAAAGGPRAYFGWPADATSAEGETTIAVLGGILAEAVSGVRTT